MFDSPIEKINFRNRYFFVKRDDLIDIRFSGNKARKLHYYFDKNNLKTLISFGGTQSNLMYSLSEFTKLKNLNFIYYSKPLGKYLKNNIDGNLKYALDNGMKLIEISHENWDKNINKLKNSIYKKNTLFINQGAMQKEAKFGIKNLALQINKFIEEKNIFNNTAVFVSSGTGATALYLEKYLDCKCYTTPCIGDEDYLLSQFTNIEKNIKYPTILNTEKKYHFGKLYKEFYEIYKELLNQTNIEFELLYDSKGWITIFENLDKLPQNIIYIHCGGILGNSTMIKRYENKFK
jgi:1-aminocyclopropane-1-carboxylate deaminase/D-cysteine desulfhydrase-like pyridoxal-dependent ACC family enzyme